MKENIFIVEGLPGVGKSYFCEILKEEIKDKMVNKKIFFFEERDINHPFHISENDINDDIWSISYKDCLNVVESKCNKFFAEKYKTEEVYIFDCSVLQRPIFCSMIMNDFSEDFTFNHLLKMYKSYKNLPQQLFFLESSDYIKDFETIYKTRGTDYREHIEIIWNNSKYSIENNLKGLEGAVEILKYFNELKIKFMQKLELKPVIINNAVKKPDIIRNKIRKMLF